MPLKLVPPRAGKTPFWYVRGTYLGVPVDRTTKASEKRVARIVLSRIKADIEAGQFARREEPTFVSAALAYVKAGGEKRFIGPLADHFEERALSSIDQQAIDEAALVLYPNATPATRNRQVYTVVSAILKHAGRDHKLKRPRGSAGEQRTEWLWPEQAFALFKAADDIDKEFGLFLRVLCYTGMRLSEALNLRWNDVRLDEGFAYVHETKTGTPRPVFIPPHIVSAMETLQIRQARVFRFTKSGRLYNLLRMAKEATAATAFVTPDTFTFHSLRHTWATWMRRYGGLDTRGLVGTGAWRDAGSVRRYEHVIASEEAMKAAKLPVEGGK